MNHKTEMKILLLSIILLPGLAIADFMGAKGSFEESLTLDGPVLLDVDTGSGSIDVRAGPGREATIIGKVRVRRNGFWKKAVDADEIIRQVEENPPIELRGNRLRVGHFSDRKLSRHVSISFEIVVPADSEVIADTGSGSITVRNIAAPVNADTGSGSVTLENINGPVKADTGSGSINADGIVGTFNADTGSGSIRADGIVGAFDADTGSGRITVAGVQEGKWRLDTGSGSVHVDLPDDAAFDLNAETNSGGITIDHPLTVEGKISKKHIRGEVRGGGPLLHIDTGSGGIRVE